MQSSSDLNFAYHLKAVARESGARSAAEQLAAGRHRFRGYSSKSSQKIKNMQTPCSHSHDDKMASYDSDSSFDDDENLTETNVLLGYASEDATDDAFSQLGGRAVCFTCFDL